MSTLVDFVSRDELGWPAMPKNTRTDQGMVAHYDAGFWLRNRRADLTKAGGDPHRACSEYWKRVESQHRGQGWKSVGYAYFVCPDDAVFEGRGVDRIQAAELPTPGKIQNGNTRYVAVTFGLGPGETPTVGALSAWHRLRRWLMDNHSVTPTVLGHRDFTSTSCPGDVVYRMVRDGTLTDESTEGDLVATLPVLKVGTRSYDVLTARALLFERLLSSRFEVNPIELWVWLRIQDFTTDLKADVIAYQKWRFPDTPAEWDGIIGPKTWAALLRVA